MELTKLNLAQKSQALMAVNPNIKDDRWTEAKGSSYLVPAGTTWSQILDYVSGSGQQWPLELYSVGFPMSRGTAVTYAVVHRCVSLISGIIAGMITSGSGSLYVVDRDGRRIKTRRTNNLTDILTYKPANDGTAPYSFYEDAIADYCLDGNCIIHPWFSVSGNLEYCRRMAAHTASTMISEKGQVVYRLTRAQNPSQKDMIEYIAKRDLIHSRWPLLVSSASDREGFAMPIIMALRSSLEVGVMADNYVKQWFQRGVQNGIHFDYAEKPNVLSPTKIQKQEIREAIESQLRSRGPVITFGATQKAISDAAQDEQTLKLREFQMKLVMGFFGIMIPFYGSDITNWGKGIEELAKLLYRFGISQHLNRFLSAMSICMLNLGENFKVDTTEFFRGDNENLAKLITAFQGDAQKAPIASQAELRKLGGLPVDIDGTIDDRVIKAQIKKAEQGKPIDKAKGVDNRKK